MKNPLNHLWTIFMPRKNLVLKLNSSVDGEFIFKLQNDLLTYFKKNSHNFNVVSHKKNKIVFDNLTMLNLAMPGYSLKTYEIEFKKVDNNINISMSCVLGANLFISVLALIPFCIDIFAGLIFLALISLFNIISYYFAKGVINQLAIKIKQFLWDTYSGNSFDVK